MDFDLFSLCSGFGELGVLWGESVSAVVTNGLRENLQKKQIFKRQTEN